MKTLLLVTDHRFYKNNDVIYDNYVFDYNFFKNYLKVFDKVKVLARVEYVDKINEGLKISSGENLSFIEFPDLRTFKFLLSSHSEMKKHIGEFNDIDSVCYRIPSVMAHSCHKVLKENNLVKPYIFEMIGDPELAFVNSDDSIPKKIIKRLYANIAGARTRKIISKSIGGSYVSFNHLQQKYPAPKDSYIESISSIRLDSSLILKELKNIDVIQKLNIIHVGSFVHVKNHSKLIILLKNLIENGFEANLTLVGSGQLKDQIIEQSKILGVNDRIDFKGQVVGKESVVRCLDENNIFILPSSSEGMPRSLIEAMSRGLVCFGASRGGIKELLTESFLFNPDDDSDMYNTIVNKIIDIDSINTSRIENLKKVGQFEFTVLEEKRIKLLNFLKESTLS